jgi:hypothetical protein
MLDRLEDEADRQRDEVLPGISRRTMRLVGFGVGAFIVLVMIMIIVVVLGNISAQNDQEAEETRLAAQRTADQLGVTSTFEAQTQDAFAATATSFLTQSPTPSNTPEPVFTLPPTPTPTITPDTRLPTSLPTPVASVPGSIIGWGGDARSREFASVFRYFMDGRPAEQFIDAAGRFPTASSDGSMVIFTGAAAGFGSLMQTVTLEGQLLQNTSDRWAGIEQIEDADMAFLSADGLRLVLVGESPSTLTTEIFLLDLSEGAEIPVQRLTNDPANYTSPALSSDGTSVVAVRSLPALEGDEAERATGADLVLIDILSRSQTSLTTDGDVTIEDSPRFAPDNQSVTYAATPGDGSAGSDLKGVAVDGSGLTFSIAPANSPADERYPVYSPDGRYLAFASNRSGAFDIFIYDQATGDLFQLTLDDDDEYPAAWINQ